MHPGRAAEYTATFDEELFAGGFGRAGAAPEFDFEVEMGMFEEAPPAPQPAPQAPEEEAEVTPTPSPKQRKTHRLAKRRGAVRLDTATSLTDAEMLEMRETADAVLRAEWIARSAKERKKRVVVHSVLSLLCLRLLCISLALTCLD